MLRDRSFRSSSSQRRSPVLVIALLIAAMLLVALDQAGMLGDLRVRATSLISPALTFTHTIGTTISDGLAQIRSPSQAEAELAALREENSKIKAENLRVQELQLEITRLRQQLRIESEKPWHLLGSSISSLTLDVGRHQILLAVGSAQGVKPGMAVIAREGSNPAALIGVVEEVGPQSASVLLITDFNSAISARIYRSDRVVDGVAEGQWQRGSRLRLEEIARDELIATGDVVVTAGLSAMFQAGLPRAAIPANIPIGIVDQVQPSGHTQQAELQPFVDPDRVRYAWVILSDNG
jgi:rod shape-determining protein MreC